ncbi:MAG: substrate-binding periplasmic protein [Aeromonadaceae bacterium]
MKLIKLGWLLLLLALQVGATPIRLVTGEFIPFSGEKLVDGGISTQIVKAAFREAGFDAVDIQFQPWTRGYQLTLQASFTATYPYAWSPQRASLFLYSAPINIDSLSWFSRGDDNRAQTGAWHKLSVCIPLGWNTRHADKLIADYQMRLYQPRGVEQCLLMLEKKRVDLLPMNDRVVFEASNKLFGTPYQFRPLLQHKQSDTFYLMISRQHPQGREIIDAFNNGLAALRSDGRYDKLLLQPTLSTASQNLATHPRVQP